MKKKAVAGLSILGLFCVGILGGTQMRKEMPYDFEVIPAEKCLQVVNTTTWADKDCIVFVKGSIDTQRVILSASNKMVQICGLENGRNYKLSILRKDLIGRLKYRNAELIASPQSIFTYTVLLGASVGKSWNLRQLASRSHSERYFWGYRGYYEFDKTSLVDELIKSPIKPDSVIIKECAAYFPRDTHQGILQIEEWVDRLTKANIEPMLATVVPITEERAKGNPIQMQSLNSFNVALRQLSIKKGLKLFDLQAALSSDSEKGFLDVRYADKDGLHLKENAYRDQLDSLLINNFRTNDKGLLSQ